MLVKTSTRCPGRPAPKSYTAINVTDLFNRYSCEGNGGLYRRNGELVCLICGPVAAFAKVAA